MHTEQSHALPVCADCACVGPPEVGSAGTELVEVAGRGAGMKLEGGGGAGMGGTGTRWRLEGGLPPFRSAGQVGVVVMVGGV